MTKTKEAVYRNARDIVNKVGVDTLVNETGRDARTIRKWRESGKIPAAHYATIQKLTGNAAKESAFSFSKG